MSQVASGSQVQNRDRAPLRRHLLNSHAGTRSCGSDQPLRALRRWPQNVHFELQVSWWLDLLSLRSNGTSGFDRARLITIASLEPGLNASPDPCYTNSRRPLMTLTSFLKHLFALSFLWNVHKAASPITDRHRSSNTAVLLHRCPQVISPSTTILLLLTY